MAGEKWKPSKEQVLGAYGKKVPDLIGPGLKVLFCGINPSLYSAAAGHHFARPGNRFWPALYAAGFTDRLFSPVEGRLLLERGYGITNVVERATATAAELAQEEYAKGGKRLEAKARRYAPRVVAVLGVSAYRAAFGMKGAVVGKQEKELAGAAVWVLPNPSGLNAHYRLEDLAGVYRELRLAVEGR
ncbi:MAG TPA: G/U mismatch-specific DNA glycosylase [Blastocatellia bacterium]|jgi:TDG/mug DNA glycosylase family protein|nr:G/U mismatch-specific DNA glycosylase [Blastocatellia bacterium]